MSISSRLTSSSTTSVSSTTFFLTLTSSLATALLETTTSSSVTGTTTSFSPISASEASPSTGTLSLLAVRADALADPHGAGLDLACACGELLLGPLHPQLVAVFKVGARALIDALVVL